MQRFIGSWRLAAVTASAVVGVAVLAAPAWAGPSASRLQPPAPGLLAPAREPPCEPERFDAFR